MPPVTGLVDPWSIFAPIFSATNPSEVSYCRHYQKHKQQQLSIWMDQDLFQYILLDEHQDSNSIQNAIIKLLVKNGNITVVGDFSQSIYSFRGAEPNYFVQFPAEYEGTKVFLLVENYRSTAPIVELGNEIISFNNEEIKKNCFSTKPGNPPSLRGSRPVAGDDKVRPQSLHAQIYRLHSTNLSVGPGDQRSS
jgi:superfamily I DNA/RNA helicase